MRRVVVKVWEFPVRLVHWTNFLSILVLCATGAYIHWPYLVTPDTAHPYVMGWMRYAHFLAGYVLLVGLVVRLYWAFVGNRFAKFGTFFPWLTAKGRRDFGGVLKYYMFTARRMPPHMGHNAIAATVYAAMFAVFWFQVISGFALFGQADPSGTAFQLTGWLFGIMSNQYVRLTHYLIMFLVGAFFINHIYAMWVSDLAEKDGTAGSMFSGYKYGEIDEFEDSGTRPR